MLGFSGIFQLQKYKNHSVEKKKNLNFIPLQLNNQYHYFHNQYLSLHAFNHDRPLDIFDDENNLCVFIGDIYNENRIASFSKYLTEKFKSKGIEYCCNLNGSYSFALYNKKDQTFFLGVDRNSIIPSYYFFIKNTLYFSWSIHNLKNMAKANFELDFEHILRHLYGGSYSLNGNTFIKNINAIYGGSYLKYKDEKLKILNISPFNYFPNESKSINSHLENTYHTLKNALSIRLNTSNKYMLGLSGGIDSRIILSMALKNFANNIECYTYGCKDFVEAKIANSISRNFNIKHYIYEFYDEIYLKYAGDGVFHSSGNSLFKHGVQLHLFNTIKETLKPNGILLGSFLDVLIGDSFQINKIANIKSIEKLVEYYLHKNMNTEAPTFKYLTESNKIALETINSIREIIFESLKAYDSNKLNDIHISYLFHSRGKKWYNMNLVYPLLSNKLILPSYDTIFLKTISKIPYSIRKKDVFRKKLLGLINNNMATFPHHDTMQRADLSYSYSEQFKTIIKDEEIIKEKIWFNSNKKIYIPSNRFDSNFKEYFRVNKNYIVFFKSLMTGPRAILANTIFNEKTIINLLNEHFEGKKSHHKILVTLLSSELSCRMLSGDEVGVNNKMNDFSKYLLDQR